MLGTCFQNHSISNCIKCAIFNGRFPAMARIGSLGLNDLIHHGAPSALAGFGVAFCEICAGDLKIDEGMPMRFVSRVKESKRGGFFGRVEAFAFSGLAIKHVEDTALSAIDSIALRHVFVHERNHSPIRNCALASSGLAVPSCEEVVAEWSFWTQF